MRKACIELVASERIAYLIAGKLGTGQCLHVVVLSGPDATTPEEARWKKALALCEKKAVELKYEVIRIRGRPLAGLPR